MSAPRPESTRDRILGALTQDESPLREEGVRLAVDHVLGRTLTELVDFHEATALVVRGLTEQNLARVVKRHVQPGFHRYIAAVEGSDEVVGGLVPDPAKDKIRRIVHKSKLPRAQWAQGLVEPALIRKLFAPVWMQLLLNFGTRLPLPGMGAASGAAAAVGRGMGGLAGRLTRSVQERAEKIADAGRTVMGGLGAEVEKRIQAAARDFSDGAAEIFRDALRDRLKSKEGRELMEQIVGQIIDHVMTTRLADVQKDMDAIDVDGIFDVVPEIVAHAAPGALIRSIIEGEVAAYLALEGHRTLFDVLSEMGLLTEVRATLIRRSSAVAQGFFATAEFEDFLGRLLEA